jgi:biotin transport system substrate-specific component
MALASPQPRVLADVVPHTWVRQAILVSGGAALVGLAAQIAFYLPWNPAVPVTLQTFAVLLVGGALGSMRGAAAMTLYAILGGIGLPWFAGQSSGFGGAAFGYIIGFIIAAFIVGKLAEHGALLADLFCKHPGVYAKNSRDPVLLKPVAKRGV